MRLSEYESRRLQEMEQRLAVEDPDLASLLSRGLGEPDPPEPFSARLGPHGPPARAGGTTTAMVIALVFLALLVFGAHVLSTNPPADENGGSSGERRDTQCHTVTMRDPACEDFRRYAPGS